MMAKDIIYLTLFKDARIHDLVSISHRNVPHLFLKVFWELGTMLNVAPKRLNDPMRDGAHQEVVQVLRQKQSGGMVLHVLLDRPVVDYQLLLAGLKPFYAQKLASEF